jgi:hypothetical protein
MSTYKALSAGKHRFANPVALHATSSLPSLSWLCVDSCEPAHVREALAKEPPAARSQKGTGEPR